MNIKDKVLSYRLKKYREGMLNNSTKRGNVHGKEDTVRIAKMKEFKAKEEVMS